MAWLAALDRCADDDHDRALVVTHSEPHPGNVIRTRAGLTVIDWDTVALVPRERDVCILQGRADALARYCARTGAPLDPGALDADRSCGPSPTWRRSPGSYAPSTAETPTASEHWQDCAAFCG